MRAAPSARRMAISLALRRRTGDESDDADARQQQGDQAESLGSRLCEMNLIAGRRLDAVPAPLTTSDISGMSPAFAGQHCSVAPLCRMQLAATCAATRTCRAMGLRCF